MDPVRWFRPPHTVFAGFLGSLCALGAALAWLCWQWLQQDRQRESQRAQERLDQAADRIARSLAHTLQDLDRWLPLAHQGNPQLPPDGIALFLNTGQDATVQPPTPRTTALLRLGRTLRKLGCLPEVAWDTASTPDPHQFLTHASQYKG
jgi:hypothetical protein